VQLQLLSWPAAGAEQTHGLRRSKRCRSGAVVGRGFHAPAVSFSGGDDVLQQARRRPGWAGRRRALRSAAKTVRCTLLPAQRYGRDVGAPMCDLQGPIDFWQQ
jgi:hypothetical protein